MSEIKTFGKLSSMFREKVQAELSRALPVRQFVIKPRPTPKDTSRGVFGSYKPAPVDRQAAMLLAKSRWRHIPVEPKEGAVVVKKVKARKKKKKKQRDPVIIEKQEQSDCMTTEEVCIALGIRRIK